MLRSARRAAALHRPRTAGRGFRQQHRRAVWKRRGRARCPGRAPRSRRRRPAQGRAEVVRRRALSSFGGATCLNGGPFPRWTCGKIGSNNWSRCAPLTVPTGISTTSNSARMGLTTMLRSRSISVTLVTLDDTCRQRSAQANAHGVACFAFASANAPNVAIRGLGWAVGDCALYAGCSAPGAGCAAALASIHDSVRLITNDVDRTR